VAAEAAEFGREDMAREAGDVRALRSGM